MTRLTIEAAPSAPTPVTRIPSRPDYLAVVARRQRAARLGAAPAITLLVIGLVAGVAHWIPELGLGIAFPEVFALLGTAVARPIFTGGAVPVGGAPDAGAAPTIAFAAALVLGWATRQGGRWRHVAIPAALALAVTAAIVALAAARAPIASLVTLIAAIACVVIAICVALVSARGYLRRGVHPHARRMPGLRAWRTRHLIAYIVVVPVPFMVGRALIGGDLRDRGAEIIGSGSTAVFDTLISSATPLAWLVGVVVGLAVWALLRVIPPLGELPEAPGIAQLPPPHMPGRPMRGVLALQRPRLIAPSIVVGLVVVLGASLLVPAAASASNAAVVDSTARVPDAPGEACPTFVLPGSSPALGLVPGSRCRGMNAYAGLVKTGSLDLDEEFDAAAGSSTPEGDAIVSSSVAGVYDPVLVVAGTLGMEGLDVVTGISFVDATVAWRFQCPDAEPFAIRLSGTGADDLSAGRGTYAGEPEAVFVGCASAVHRLDPRTGTPF